MGRHRRDRRASRTDAILPWAEILTGLDPERVRAAAATVASWPIPAIAERLGTPRDVDEVVRVVLLAEDVALLTSRGVPENKLMAKLRDVAQFESTWAEIRATAIFVQT